jgi:hypothetical protein
MKSSRFDHLNCAHWIGPYALFDHQTSTVEKSVAFKTIAKDLSMPIS